MRNQTQKMFQLFNNIQLFPTAKGKTLDCKFVELNCNISMEGVETFQVIFQGIFVEAQVCRDILTKDGKLFMTLTPVLYTEYEKNSWTKI